MTRRVITVALALAILLGAGAVISQWPGADVPTAQSADAQPACSTCDARHSNLDKRREAMKKLTAQE